MYETPIKLIKQQMETEIEGMVLRAVQRVGVDVDKEELIRALEYDRGQYEKGYRDGSTDAVVHARLVYSDGYIIPKCSACESNVADSSWAFCPHCGAMLDD